MPLNFKSYRFISFSLLTILLFLNVSTSYADTTNTTDTTDSWKFNVAPYIWVMNMNGRVRTGAQTVHINEDFADILKQFHGGGMLWLDAQNGKLDIFLNSLYADLTQTTRVGPFAVRSTNKFGLFTAGAAYDVYQKMFNNDNQITLSPYMGVRYTINNVNIKVASFSVSDNQNWYDPIVGARLRYVFNPQWFAIIAADVGGTNFSDHNSYNLNGFIGYRPQSVLKNTTFYVGYRMLYQNYLTGSGANCFQWDMRLFGPVVGVSFQF